MTTEIDTACQPDAAVRFFRDEGIEEDVWARGMCGTTGTGGSISAVGSSGGAPSYVNNLMPKSHQVDTNRARAALAEFLDLHRVGVDTCDELSNAEEATAYLMASLSIVERIFSRGGKGEK